MNMPVLRPLPIATKTEFPWMRIKNWIFAVRQWEVMEDWVYQIPDGPRIVIPAPFVFDGASIPRILWAILSPTGLLLIPGLVHDFAYRYDYLWARDAKGVFYKYDTGAGQAKWDKLFYLIGDEINGMSMLDAMAWGALALGGRFAWKSNRKKNAQQLYPKGYRK